MIARIGILVLLLSSPLPAAGSTEIPLGKEKKASVLLLEDKAKQEASVQVNLDGKKRQLFPSLGAAFAPLHFHGIKSSVVKIDLDKDGTDEFLVRATQPPLVGSLWLFRWDPQKNAFSHVLTATGDRSFPVPLDGPVDVGSSGEVSFSLPGKPGKVVYHWNGKAYVQR